MTNPDDLSDLVQGIHDEQAREQSDGAAETPPTPASTPAAAGGRRRKRLLIGTVIGVAAVLGASGATWATISAMSQQSTAAEASKPAAPKRTPSPTPTPEPTPEPAPPVEEVPVEPPAPQWSVDDPASYQVVVNKQRPFNPIDWAPGDLVMPNVPNQNGQPMRAEAAAAAEAMYAEASAAGVPFTIASGFRDYYYQVSLFDSYVASDGVEAAETYSARAGFSEHQTGLVMDITECGGCSLSEAFGGTPQGIWARDNAYRFGFIMRYQPGQEPIVGYVYEPWHFRYVGPEVAADMQAKGIPNLEDYFGLPAAPTY